MAISPYSTAEPIMPQSSPCGTHKSLLLVFFSLAIISLVITKCEGRQIRWAVELGNKLDFEVVFTLILIGVTCISFCHSREDMTEVEAAMNAFSHSVPQKRFK